MKTSLLIVFLLAGTVISAQPIDTTNLKVKLVDIDLRNYPNVRDFCISEDGDEAFFTVQGEKSTIVCVQRAGGKWLTPKTLPFCDKYMYLEPFLSSDGKKLFFVSNRPVNPKSKQNFDIWYVERTGKQGKWSKPHNLGNTVNSENDEFFPTLSENNNLYFTMVSPNGFGEDDIYFCEWNGSEYAKPVLLDQKINSDGAEYNAFIAKDESFLIYTKHKAKDGFGSGDLYIARKDKNTNQWQVAQNLGGVINSPFMDYCPFYDSKNEMLYFTSKRNSFGLDSKIYKVKVKL